ncbi:MAG: acyltransferase [Spirochaetes bacterium GWF1_41_5]|nr:MAG: acyltransferase [Spirochaetes bacterium GWF1_41_5]HBE02861.1 MBOAT family protein [Spirochaetia bacterium]
MLFHTPEFLILFIITFIIYYLPGAQNFQLLLLIISSFVFYAWHIPLLVILLIGSILLNALVSFRIAHSRAQKAWAAAGITANLLILAFFKYSSLLARTFLPADHIAGFLLSIPLPVGISFYTFQGISLLADVLRSRYEKRPDYQVQIALDFTGHLRQTALFIAFFPQLVAGPIVKAYDFLPQIKGKFLKDIDWNFAVKALVTGYFLKTVIADNLKDYTVWISWPFFNSLSTLTLLSALFGYSMQIFADFAGYSLIAIGLAALFGYTLRINFNFPYLAKSCSEFWSRWHISLSSWLKEYLYISLGGNRKGSLRTYFNLFIVMFLGGLWHGAAWSYAIWGTWHGLALAIERFIGKLMSAKVKNFLEKPAVLFLRILLVFFFVTISWLLFKLPEFKHVLFFISAFFSNINTAHKTSLVFAVLLYSLPVIFYYILHALQSEYNQFKAVFSYAAPFVYGVMLFLIIINSGEPGAFIYFQF